MSIVRVGLAETKNYSEGWDGIFAKGKKPKPAKARTSTRKKKPTKSKR